VVVDEILVAAGRLPNVEGLHLEAANVVCNLRGIEVDDTLRTTNPDIYGVRGCGFPFPKFAHVADATTARHRVQYRFSPAPRRS
jgi:pyruvate/2-oxoglutarate dehydrogenase complex dihydrolipoamide dehydrogenase (E3) component